MAPDDVSELDYRFTLANELRLVGFALCAYALVALLAAALDG